MTQNLFDIIQNNYEIKVYLDQADKNFKALGYTEQGVLHAKHTSSLTEKILTALNFPEKDITLAKTAAYLHDIGCAISYKNHAQNGAFIVNKIFTKLGINDEDKFAIVNIVGTHEDIDIIPVSELAAAVTLADKTDVRRQRVIKTDFKLFDQHDRVHYAVVKNNLNVDTKQNKIVLDLTIDDNICSVLDYFELFMTRIEFCKKSAGKLGLKFEFYINNVKYL